MPPARLLSVLWMLLTHARVKATQQKTCTDKKTPTYLAATPVAVAWMMNPTAATVLARMMYGARIFVRSDSHVKSKIAKKHSTYGGADKPLLWILVKAPIWLMMVGTNSGNDAKLTLQLK